jgi:type IV pilus assembly protein PilA
MRRVILCAAVMMLGAGILCAQTTVAPQTARQALLEMFFSKTPGTLVKHLPSATRAALEKSGALARLQEYSTMASQLETQGQNVQTFETGSVLLSAENPKTSEKVEITVENDSLRGDQDDIELSIHNSANGQPHRIPFMPQITFSLKQEAQIWKLNEISITMRVPLADPDFLKAMADRMSASAPSTAVASHAGTPAQTAGSDAMVVAAMRTILTAEIAYTSSYPTVGFTCTLSNLDGFGGGEPNEHQAMLINSGLASGKRYGFVFTLSGCSGTPATSFHLSAAPNGNTFGRKAFCADESGVIRSSNDGNPATCMASGSPVQ